MAIYHDRHFLEYTRALVLSGTELPLAQVPASLDQKLFVRDRRPELYGEWLTKS